MPSYAAGGRLPTLLAQHDVNGDGHLDLIVLNVNTTAKTETVSLLLGTGTGGYEAPKTMATYPSSYGVPLAGDVNGDGHLDLVFSISGTSPQTRVYLGSGETFETTAKVSTGVNCASFPPVGCELQLADLNKDGNPDLVEYGQNGVAAMLGEGNGSFKAPVYAPNSIGPFAIGDFNNDGIPDIADTGFIGDMYGLQIQVGNGNGTFRAASSEVYTYSNGQGGAFGLPVAADLRGNGDTDVIFPLSDGVDCGTGGFAVLLGNGNGTFANPVIYGSGGFTYNITAVDMNGDGRPDIVAVNQEGSSFSVFVNQGGGKFGMPTSYMAPQGVAGSFVVGNLGNGRPDLTVSTQNGVDVFLNEGGGKLKAPQALEQDGSLVQTWALDLNHDGIPDLEVNSSLFVSGCTVEGPGEPIAYALVSKSGVPFAVNNGISSGAQSTAIVGGGDFNGDGYPDVLTFGFIGDGQFISDVIFNNHQGAFTSFGPTIEDAGDGVPGGTGVIGDFNRDGFADEAGLVGSEIRIEIGDGKGNLNPGASYTVDGNVSSLFTRDLNGDGKLDIVAVSSFDKVLQVLLGNGDGTFQAPKTYSLANSPVSIDFADFNRDGKTDIVAGGGNGVTLLLNNGNGTFKAGVNYAAGGPVRSIAAINLTGNGNDDVLVADTNDNKIFLLTGNGKGTFAAPVNYYPGGSSPLQLIVADYNADGAQDVLVADATTQGYMILYNTGGTFITLTSSNKTPTAGQSVTFTATISASVAGSGTPTGTVTFRNGSATLGTATLSGGKATFHTASLSAGTHSITAVYNGNTSFNPHASAAVTETVN